MTHEIGSTTTRQLDPENIGVYIAVGILSLCALELEIYMPVSLAISPHLPLPANAAKKPLLGEGLNKGCS